MNILKLNAEVLGGGANQIATALLDSYFENGHQVMMGVRGIPKTVKENRFIFEIPNEEQRNTIYRIAKKLLVNSLKNRIPIIPKISTALMSCSEPIRLLNKQIGREDFNFPGSHKMLDLIPFTPDIIHCHNLHGNFFDLRLLVKLSKSFPVVITLHDCWTFTGHCVYPFECEKWKKICHHCEHLDKPIKINRDASTRNQSIKSKIYRDSRLFVASPSEWLTDMAKKSILKNRFTEFRTISNGVDEKLFKVNPKLHNKEKINISKNNFVALFIGSGASKNKAKGLSNLISVIKDLSRRQINIKITFLVLGDNFKTKRFGNDITLKSGGWMHDKNEIVKYYNASDLYIHLANAENFPTTILEAMHCGLPVIGSNIGGIPEQIVHGKTGFLFENHQTSEIANKIIQLIRNPKLRKDIGSNGKERAVKEFTQNKMAKNYLDWFEEILSERKTISREC